jgi:probable phosphoglycerate mutase
LTATQLLLVRHGETAWNAEGRVQGQTDIPLNATGLAQARAVASVLGSEKFDAIYSSDLQRVQQTAAPTAKRLGMPVVLDPALRERHYGMFETLTYAEVREKHPEDYARFRDKELDYGFRTGESLRTFNERSLACIDAIVHRHAGQRVLVFTHGGVLEMVYRRAKGTGLTSVRNFEIPNAALNMVEVSGTAWNVMQWAERAHLDAALDDLKEV